jgi:hypothetical protein
MLRPFRFLLPLLALAPALLAETPSSSSQFTFIRGQQQEKLSSLQTLSEEFKPSNGQGPSIWLIGVAHLGTPEYYAAIQKKLDVQSTVLFEGVGADKLQKGAKLGSENGIQGQLAKALGLVFQLDAIDYQRQNFVNCDMTVDGLEKAIANRASKKSAPNSSPTKKSGTTNPSTSPAEDKASDSKLPSKVDNQTFNSLMQALHGEGDMAAKLGGMIGLMGSTPEMRETTKLTLIEALGQASEMIDLAKSISPDIKDLFEVLITERNEEVIRQLQARIPRVGAGKTIAVFYGAAHMDEIAKRLTEELHYTPGAQVWDTAFTADGSKSIMQPAQIKMMMQMMRTQLQNPDATKGNGLGGLLNLLAPQEEDEKPAPAAK